MSTYSERGEKLKKENKTAVDEQMAVKKEELDLQIDQQLQNAEKTAASAIDAVDTNYRSVVDSAAVQRELDRRQIRETMANMGLSRSGLNATQQTAVQLSAGNKQAAAAVQRQAAVDSLKQSLAEYRMKSETDRRVGKQEIEETAQKGIAEYDAEVDKWVSEAESTEYKAQQEATAKKYEADTEATTALAKMQIESAQKQQEAVTERNLKLIDGMHEEGTIDDNLYLLAAGEGWTATEVKTVNERSGVIKKADNSEGSAYTKDDAAAEILTYYLNGRIGESAVDYMCSLAGITQEEFDTFVKENANKTTK